MENVEIIRWHDQPVAYIVRRQHQPTQSEFLTPPDFKQQLGLLVYSSGAVVPPHVHRPLQRSFAGTTEVLLVRSGQVEVVLYNDGREHFATRLLNEGDIILLISGGHGFRYLEDSTILEVKQGPYGGEAEKEMIDT